MNDTKELLGQLTIEREDETKPRRYRPWTAGVTTAIIIGILVAMGSGSSKAIEVETTTARAINSASQASVLDASGYVVARRQATVSSKVTGKVVAVMIEEGQSVEAGDVLARIDDTNVAAQLALAEAQEKAAIAQLTEVRVQLAEAKRQLQRNRELAERDLVSSQTLDSLEAQVDGLQARLSSAEQNVDVASKGRAVQQRSLDDTVVRAPFDGVITSKNAQPGEMISPLSAGGDGTRTGIGTLVDMTSLEIEVDVNENFINRVRPGQAVTAKLNAYSDWPIPARVIAVIPTADRGKATVKVRVGLDQLDARILPEMGVRVSFMTEPSSSENEAPQTGVIVPQSAIQNGRVFVLSNGKLESRAVKTGTGTRDGALVVAGLRPGEKVVSRINENLSDGIAVVEKP